MKAFVINLAASTKRISHMSLEFERVGIEFERFPAVDGRLLDTDDMARARGSDLSTGEVACFLSHIGVWMEIAAGRDGYAAVFEDDVYLSEDAWQFLSGEDWIPHDIDLIKLETILAPVQLGKSGIKIGDYRLLRAESFHFGSAGYVMSRRLAEHLASTVSIDKPVDDFLFDGRPYWQLSPAICIQDMFFPHGKNALPSDIMPSRLSQPKTTKLKPYLSRWQKLKRETLRLQRKLMHQRRVVVPFSGDSRP